MHRPLAAPPSHGLRLGARQSVGQGVRPHCGEDKPGQWGCRRGEMTMHSHSESWTEGFKRQSGREVQGLTAGAASLGAFRATLKFGKGRRMAAILSHQ